MQNETISGKLHLSGMFLTFFGTIMLGWIGWLTWYDITTWNKDITLIFLGSRIGEAISLGIGAKVIHYLLVSLALLTLGSFTLLRRRSKAIKSHHRPLSGSQPQKRGKTKKEELPIEAAETEDLLSGCPHHFGYLASRPKSAIIPQECLICPRLGDCMVITVIDKRKVKRIS